MSVVLGTPGAGDRGDAVDGLADAVAALRDWQRDGGAFQLHPGDVGWFWRFGAEATASAVRTWSRDGRMLAVGLLDGPDLLRLAIAPEARQDDELVRRLASDVSDPTNGVLPPGVVSVEAPSDSSLLGTLTAQGWAVGEAWTPLHLDLRQPVADAGIRVEVVGVELAEARVAGARVAEARVAEARLAEARVAIQRASFERSTFTVERWRAMVAGLPYADARCLLGFDELGTPVAAITVWSAGVGKPGLIEPLAVHPDHRGHRFGTAITLAGAAALRELGSSSAMVCTESSNVRAVATYKSAGFEERAEIHDRVRSN